MNEFPYAHLPYRPGVGILLFNERGEVFVGMRIDNRAEAWQMPQGGVDEGETPEQAALRELEEEVGTAKAEIVARSRSPYRYDLPAELVPQLWKGRFRGQEQHWFALRFLGTDADINIETPHPEFRAWKWAPLNQVPELIVPFKQQLYSELVAEFWPILFPGSENQHR